MNSDKIIIFMNRKEKSAVWPGDLRDQLKGAFDNKVKEYMNKPYTPEALAGLLQAWWDCQTKPYDLFYTVPIPRISELQILRWKKHSFMPLYLPFNLRVDNAAPLFWPEIFANYQDNGLSRILPVKDSTVRNHGWTWIYADVCPDYCPLEPPPLANLVSLDQYIAGGKLSNDLKGYYFDNGNSYTRLYKVDRLQGLEAKIVNCRVAFSENGALQFYEDHNTSPQNEDRSEITGVRYSYPINTIYPSL